MPEIANAVPHLRVQWDYREADLTPEQAAERLREGDPSVEVRPRYDDGLEIAVWMLESGEERIVGRQVRGVLADGHRRRRLSLSARCECTGANCLYDPSRTLSSDSGQGSPPGRAYTM